MAWSECEGPRCLRLWASQRTGDGRMGDGGGTYPRDAAELLSTAPEKARWLSGHATRGGNHGCLQLQDEYEEEA